MASLSATVVVVFLCFIALRTTLANSAGGHVESGSSSGGEGGQGSGGPSSGSGSGREVFEEEEGCATPLSSEDDEGDVITDSMAYTDVMCNLLCMEHVTNNSEHRNAEIENRTIGGMWKFSFFPQFSSENENKNCRAYQQLAECVRGCQVKANTPTLTRNDCRDQCKSQCDETITTDDHYFNPYCRIDCNKAICRQGCDTYDTIEVSSNRPGIPVSPVSAPVIEPSGDPTLFSVSLSDTAPTANDQEHPHTPVGIVYHVREQSTQVTRYFGQVDPEEPLVLDGYACRTIVLSFVVVNRFGVSHESPPLTFRVSGEHASIKPTDVAVGSVRLDKRPGFFGYVFLTISWQHPPGYIEGLFDYVVKAKPFSSRNLYVSPPLNTKMLTVYSERESDGVFVLGKTLDIHVCSETGDVSECAMLKYDVPDFDSLEANSVKITDCVPHWNGMLFDYTLHWTVPEFVAFGSEIFTEFLVIVEEKLERNKRYIERDSVRKSPNQTSYSYTWKNLNPLQSQFYYEFGVSIQWAPSTVYQPEVQHAYCRRPAVPPLPSPVMNVTLSDPVIGENIRFVFQWRPPVTTNGQLTKFEGCLGGRKLDQFEIYDSSAVPSSDENDTLCIDNIETDKTSAVWDHRAPRPDCLYFQMRAHTVYGGGNWSEVVVISHGVVKTEGNCSITRVEIASAHLSQKEHLSVAHYVIVLAVFGGILVIIVLVALMVVVVGFARIRRRKTKLRHILKRQPSDETDLMFTGGKKKSIWSQPDMFITADEWEIPPGQVIIENSIGEGAFGEVMKGTVKGPLSNPKVPRALKSAICIPVAIKVLKSSAKGSERRDFLQEIEMMKKVSEGQNPHVVSMVGCVTVQEPLSLITEFVPFGNLLQYLRTNQKMYTDPTEVPETGPYVELGNVNSADLISFAYQIASGMEYLSSLGIVHRDLASRNILVGEGKVLKITDLGMSRETDEVYVQKTKGRVPLKWMAVESIITREFTSASDVWAYGVVLWEIGTLGGFPYPTIQNEDLLPLLKRGYRMEKPDNCSSEVYAIMLECWQEEAGKRPTFSNLRARFDSMLLAERKETYIDLQIDASKPYYNPDLSTDLDAMDGFLHAGKKSPKIGSRISATSPFHARGITPSHSDFFELPDALELQKSPTGSKVSRTTSLDLVTDRKNVYVDDPSVHHLEFSRSPIILRGQRSPRSPTLEERFPRPASLQLVTERKNVYVDDPSLRRSVCISPQGSSSSGYQEVERNPVQMDRDEASEGGVAISRSDGLAVPQILISFT